MAERTIAAVSTPLGEGGIGIIRISGSEAIAIADRCFFAFSGERLSELAGYRAAYGEIRDGDTVLDDAVALVFRAPKSYTGEDVVELSVHGGRVMVKSVLRTVLKYGATAAQPGEFSKRAFLNGKLDLTRAESIAGLISAESEAALRLSRAARSGRVSRETEGITERLLELSASLAAYADYPDEDLPELSPERFAALLEQIKQRLQIMLSTYDAGKIIREGINCAIVGKPNVGKSTLMNRLCGSDRSIVTDIAGTTRDVVEETVVLGDITLRLADTAGIRETEDTVERVGVDRAKSQLSNAGLVLAVFDGSAPPDADDRTLISLLHPQSTIALLNKCDLPERFEKTLLANFTVVEISAKRSSGLEDLTRAVAAAVHTDRISEDAVVLISERQRNCAARALNAASEAAEALRAGCTLDAVGVLIDDALSALLELTGRRVTNEVTDEVFRRFCVGK